MHTQRGSVTAATTETVDIQHHEGEVELAIWVKGEKHDCLGFFLLAALVLVSICDFRLDESRAPR